MLTSAAPLVSLSLLGYTYVGYPALVGVLSKMSPLHTDSDEAFAPTVSVLIAAHNAEKLLDAKLDSVLGVDYPAELLEVIVYSDGSTDRTHQILQRRASADSRVKVIYATERRGKPTAINAMREVANGEILVMTDVRQRLDRGAVHALVRHFVDPTVGCVSGNLVLEGDGGAGFYWRYEKWIREQEGNFRSTVGVTGALYAIRACDLGPLPEDTILDDVWIPSQLRMQDKKVLFDHDAIAFDTAAEDAQEFKRKVRTLAGNFQLFARMPRLLSPIANPSWIEPFSHKALRLAGPWLLGALAASSLAYAASPPAGASPAMVLAMRALAAGQVLFYGAAAVGPRAGRMAGVARTFVVMNVAAAVGLFRFATGEQRVTW